MTLTIGGLFHTDALEEGTLSIRYYGAMRTSFRATLQFNSVPINFPKVGQEILVKEGETILWGGILVETEEVCHSTSSLTMTLRGQGYEQILQRLCLPYVELSQVSPSDAARHIFQTYMNPQDGLTIGTIEEGLAIPCNYIFYPAKASSVFDRLANDNGFLWWVDKEKKFHMRSVFPQTQQNLCIDLTRKKENRLEDIQTLVHRASTAGYKNVQYVYNRTTGSFGRTINVGRISEMMQRYGGGEYSASAVSSAVTSQNEAQAVAQQILSGCPGLGEIEFTTDQDAFVPGQIINVTAPVCGLKNETPFCVTEIRAVHFFDRFRYTVVAQETDSGPLTSTCWEAILAGGSTN